MYYEIYNDCPEVVIDINECIICLEQKKINTTDNVTLINDMHFIIKNCDCICYAHHDCIKKWIETNAVCPICKNYISFPTAVQKNKDIEQGSNTMLSNTMHCDTIAPVIYVEKKESCLYFSCRIMIILLVSFTILHITSFYVK